MKISIIIVFTIFMFNHTSCNMKNIEHKDFTVNPYIGAEPILFGMNKQKINGIFVDNVISGPNTYNVPHFLDSKLR